MGTLGFSSWSAYHTEQNQSQGAEVIYLYPAISAKLPLFSAKSKSHSIAIISDSLDEIKLAVEKNKSRPNTYHDQPLLAVFAVAKDINSTSIEPFVKKVTNTCNTKHIPPTLDVLKQHIARESFQGAFV